MDSKAHCSREITKMQEAFAVELVTNGGNATAAARAAGYSPKGARVLAHRLLRHEGVQAAIRTRQWQMLNGHLTARSLNVLRQALDMSNETVPWSVRIAAAKTILDRSGMTLTEQPGRREGNEPRANLSGLLMKLEAAQALQMQPTIIDAEPIRTAT